MAGTKTRAYGWTYYEQGIGVLKSVDGGNTWQTTNIATFPAREKNINVIRFHPTNPNVVLAAGNKFIYKSTDAGTTWSIVCESPHPRVDGNGPGFIDIEFLPSNPNIVLASTDFRGDDKNDTLNHALLFRSTNAGSTWTDVTPSNAYVLGMWGATAIAIDVTPADPNNFYMMYQDSVYYPNPQYFPNYYLGMMCIRKSTNGINWTKIAQFRHSAVTYNDVKWGSWNKFEFEVSNSNLNTFYAGGGVMHKSVNGGATWGVFSEYWPNHNTPPIHSTHADIRGLIQLPSISGDYLIMANDGGIAKTMNGGSTWWNLNGNGLTISECFAVGTFNNNDNLVVGLMDNGTKLYNSNEDSWLTISSAYGDGGWTEVNYANDNIVYGMSNGTIMRSTNGGNSFVSTGYRLGSLWDRFHLDPSDHTKLWAGTNVLRMYNSSTWTTKYSFAATGQRISAIHVAPSNGDIIYVAMEFPTWGDPLQNKLFKSTNGGDTFTDISSGCLAYDWAYINDFCIDPYNSDRIWAGCAMYYPKDNFPSQGEYRVIYSEDGGITWADISDGLPPFPVSYLAYRDGSDDEIYAATEGGVYRWNKALQIWECFNNGFPPVFVTKLEINNCKNKIVASTWGHGIWEAPLPPINNTITISTSQTWNENSFKSIASNIIIPGGVTLTVKGTVKMGHNRTILIKPGAKLVVDGGVISNACPNKLWEGILVSGNGTLLQTAQNQGTLELKNNAVIENARNAVATYEYGSNGRVDYATTGGIIYADNAIFKNNRRSVEFLAYPSNNTSRQNVSRFNNCTFIVDNNNFFAVGNANFLYHISMWSVSGVRIKGCEFKNNITITPDRAKAIYTIDAGYTVDEYCYAYSNIYPCPPCLDSKFSEFEGFETAIESSTSQKQYALTIDRSKFENNIIGVRIDGKNSFQLSRLEMLFSPIQGRHLTGIYLDQCTDYKVEANIINTNAINSSSGIWINNAGTDENRIYQNEIRNSQYGIRVSGLQLTRPPNNPPLTGLQFTCNDLRHNNTNGIYVGSGGRIRYLQGALNSGADNDFTKPPKTYNFYLDAQHYTSIIYYHAPGMEPVNITPNVDLFTATKNLCGSTLCSTTPHTKSGDVQAESLLKEYRELNYQYAEMMHHFYAQGYDKVLTGYFAGEIGMEGLKEIMPYLEALSAITEYMAELSHGALFNLKMDTVIDLAQIRDWYDEMNTVSAKYSLAETYEQLGKFEEGLKILALIPEMFDLNEDEMREHHNYVSLFTFRHKIKESGKTIAELDDAEIEQMRYFAKASHGLSSVMARGVLCFFYEICIEAESGKEKGEGNMEKGETLFSKATLVGVDGVAGRGSLYENITIHPNPTTGELVIVSGGLKVENIEILDVYGRKLLSHHLITSSSNQKIDISHLNNGIYFVKIVTKQGEIVKKVVKQ